MNDIECKNVTEIADEFRNTIQGISIIISEIILRKDNKDKDVIACNRLPSICSEDENIFLINHDNLRDGNYSNFYNTKHIHYRATGLFVSSIKQMLRKAYGIIYKK